MLMSMTKNNKERESKTNHDDITLRQIVELSYHDKQTSLQIFSDLLQQLDHQSKKKQVANDMKQSFNDWSTKQNMLILYVRWGKKTLNCFHSDSIAAIRSLCSECPSVYPDVSTVLRSRSLTYVPCTKKRKGSEFYNSITYTPTPVAKGVMESIGNHIVFLQNMVIEQGNGKVGMRSGVGPSSKKRSLNITDGEPMKSFVERNMIELHKEASLVKRINRCLDHRCLSYDLCSTIFKGKDSSIVSKYSIELTESTGTNKGPYDFLCILAGVCLIFNSVADANNEGLHTSYWNNVATLKRDAEIKARAQVTKELENPIVSSTIASLNRKYRRRWGLHQQQIEGSPDERILALVRCAVFQRWLGSKHQSIRSLKEVVVRNLASIHSKFQECYDKDKDKARKKLQSQDKASEAITTHRRTTSPSPAHTEEQALAFRRLVHAKSTELSGPTYTSIFVRPRK